MATRFANSYKMNDFIIIRCSVPQMITYFMNAYLYNYRPSYEIMSGRSNFAHTDLSRFTAELWELPIFSPES